MKNFYYILTSLILSMIAISCNNDETVSIKSDPTPKVVKLSDYLSLSRGGSQNDVVDQDVLVFENEEEYLQVLEGLRNMSEQERLDYFDEIGFTGAYSIMSHADTELEDIFDMDETDSIAVCNAMQEYLVKYDRVLDFNDNDSTDVTPSLLFQGEDLQLVGSVNGYVIVDGEFITPDESTEGSIDDDDFISLGSRGMAYDGRFIEYKSVNVKNGKYRSYFRIGRQGDYIAFKTETYRNILFWKKYDKKCGYDGILQITDMYNRNPNTYTIKTKTGSWRLYGANATKYSPRFNMKLTNFSSTRNSKNKISKTINNITVK